MFKYCVGYRVSLTPYEAIWWGGGLEELERRLSSQADVTEGEQMFPSNLFLRVGDVGRRGRQSMKSMSTCSRQGKRGPVTHHWSKSLWSPTHCRGKHRAVQGCIGSSAYTLWFLYQCLYVILECVNKWVYVFVPSLGLLFCLSCLTPICFVLFYNIFLEACVFYNESQKGSESGLGYGWRWTDRNRGKTISRIHYVGGHPFLADVGLVASTHIHMAVHNSL